jgi:hypothetical protein
MGNASLTLTYLSTTGQIGAFDFVPGSADVYNQAAQDFQQSQATLAAREAAAEASEQAAYTSCSSQVAGHDAMLIVSGGYGAVSECEQIVTSIQHLGAWQAPTYPAGSPTGREWTCAGHLDGFRVDFYDTGGAVYATDACIELGLL